MIQVVAALLLVTSTSLPSSAAVSGPPHAAPTSSRLPVAAPLRDAASREGERLAQGSPSHDSLKNGAITGAIAGGLAVAVLATAGCAIGDALGGQESSCAGPLIIGTAIGAGLGALIGVGVDAMFEQAPYPHAGPHSMRKGLRVSLRF